MKKINKLIALLIVCMAMPALAGAQVLKNAYFNVDWQINSPFGQDFSKKTSGWGAHAEGGYYVIPNFAIGAFISYHTNNEYVDRQTIPRENNHGSPVPKTTLRLQNTTSGSLRRRIIDKDKTGRTAGGPDKWNFSDTRLHHPLNGNA